MSSQKSKYKLRKEIESLIFLKLFSIFLINSNNILFLLNESNAKFSSNCNKYWTFSGIESEIVKDKFMNQPSLILNNEDFDIVSINSIGSILMLKWLLEWQELDRQLILSILEIRDTSINRIIQYMIVDRR